jgi:N-acetylglucosamine kinase-like BadF-type ATPase
VAEVFKGRGRVRKGGAKFLNIVNECASEFEESVDVIAFGSGALRVFFRGGEQSVGSHFEGVSVEVACSSVKWSLVVKGIDEVNRKVGRYCEKVLYQ